MGCGSDLSAPDPEDEHEQSFTHSVSELGTCVGSNDGHPDSPDIHDHASQNMNGRHHDEPVQENPDMSAIRNSDTTCLDTNTQLTSYDPYLQHLLFPTPALRERTTNDPRLAPFWRNITPERPLPLEPAISPISTTDLRHRCPRMPVTVIELPWGGFSFMAPIDFDQYVDDDNVFQLQGQLIGWWRMMQFKWERGGWAFVFVRDESRLVQAQIAIPRACVRMEGPVPKMQYEANLIADRRMTQRQRTHAENQARQMPPPPPPTPVGAAKFSTPLVWNEDVEGMFVMDDE